MNPVVSAICLTTHPRRAAMLDQSLSSFFAQTIVDLSECVLVNDGEPLRSLHPQCVVLNVRPGLSIGEKRNIGLRAARGWAVATFDDDDISFERRLEDELRTLHGYGVGACRSESMWVADASLNIVGLITGPCYPTMMVRKDDLDKVEGFPEISYLEDLEAFLRIRMRGVKVHAIREPFYVHRRHSSNVSGANGEKNDVHFERSDQEHPGIAAAQARVRAIIERPGRYVESV